MPKIEFIARGLAQVDDHLLLCRSIAGGYHYLPGGHIEFSEDAAAALAREMVEETGLRVRVGEPLGVVEVHFEASGRRHHEVNVVFHMELMMEGVGLVPCLEPKIGFEWVKDLGGIDFRPASMLDLVQAWLDGQRGPVFRSDSA